MPEAYNEKVTVALHVHTLYSACSETKLEQIGDYCRRRGVDVLGVTDHDTIAGALALRSVVGDKVRLIIGEEIKTRDGEIVGLFLEQEIPPGLNARETCERIKGQGGLVYIPHPFDPFKIHRLRKEAMMDVLEMIDIMEVFNAKLIFPFWNIAAERFAEKHDIVPAAGSDAHYLNAIDICVNEIDDFSTPEEFLRNLRNGRLIARRSGSLRAWYVGLKNVLLGEGHVVKRYGRDRMSR